MGANLTKQYLTKTIGTSFMVIKQSNTHSFGIIEYLQFWHVGDDHVIPIQRHHVLCVLVGAILITKPE